MSVIKERISFRFYLLGVIVIVFLFAAISSTLSLEVAASSTQQEARVTPQACTTTPITSGQTVTGSLTQDDCTSLTRANRFADRFTFNGTAGQQVDILITAASFDTHLILYGPVGNVLAQDDDGGQGGEWISLNLPATGGYTIEITSAFSQSTGNYTFRFNSECMTFPVSTGQFVNGSLTVEDCMSLNRRERFVDRYTFNGSSGQRVDVLITAANFDTDLILLGPIGNVVVEDDDGGQGGEWISRTLTQDGTHTILITSAFSRTLGNYVFRPNLRCNAQPTGSGQIINGSLTVDDCMSVRRADRFADRYTFNAPAGQQVNISIPSANFDTHLILFGPIGNVVDEDDDGGQGGERISMTLSTAGTHTIEITSAFSRTLGSYTLTSTGTGTPCSYQLNASSQSFASAGGSGSVNVSAPGGCAWTAVSNAQWIAVTSGTAGSGNGSVNYTVAANAGDSRTGMLTIAGQTLTVTQSGPNDTRPVITDVAISGKKLIVRGRNFAIGASLFLNGQKQKKTSNDAANPSTVIVAKKSGPKIERGQTVMIEVQNPDGSRSDSFLFTRP